MAFVAAVCPQCGGQLQVPDDRDVVKCMYCAVDVIVRQAIILRSGNLTNFLQLARHELDVGNYGQAHSHSTRALEIDPASWEAWYLKGVAAGRLSTWATPRIVEMWGALTESLRLANNANPALKKDCAEAVRRAAVSLYFEAVGDARQMENRTLIIGEFRPRVFECITLINQTVERGWQDAAEGIARALDLMDDAIEKAMPGLGITDPVILTTRVKYRTKLKEIRPQYVPPAAASSCFVVTATMGDADHRVVRELRNFRDAVLLQSRSGSALVRQYWRIGPVVARVIARSMVLRGGCFLAIVLPAYFIARCWRWGRRQQLRRPSNPPSRDLR